jgi:hypothetical protein
MPQCKAEPTGSQNQDVVLLSTLLQAGLPDKGACTACALPCTLQQLARQLASTVNEPQTQSCHITLAIRKPRRRANLAGTLEQNVWPELRLIQRDRHAVESKVPGPARTLGLGLQTTFEWHFPSASSSSGPSKVAYTSEQWKTYMPCIHNCLAHTCRCFRTRPKQPELKKADRHHAPHCIMSHVMHSLDHACLSLARPSHVVQPGSP